MQAHSRAFMLESRQPGRPWLVLILGALSAMAPLSIDMYLPALPQVASAFGVNASTAQLSITFCLLGLAVGQVLAGPVSDSRGRRGPLLFGLALYAVASFFCALTASVWIFTGLRLVEGLSGAAGIVIARTMARDYFSGAALTRFFGLLMLVNGAAPVLAPVIGAQLLRWTSWHGIFLFLFAISVVILAAVVWGLPESLPPQKRRSGELRDTLATMRRLVANRDFMSTAFAQYLVYAGMFAYIAGSPFVLQDIFHLTPEVFSWVFATNGLGIIAAAQMASFWAGRYGERRVMDIGVWAAGAGAVGLLPALIWHWSLWALLIPLFVVVSSVGVVSTVGTTLALENQAHAAGSASGILGLGQMLFGAAVAPLVGLGGIHAAWPMGAFIVLCDVGAVACYYGFSKKRLSYP